MDRIGWVHVVIAFDVALGRAILVFDVYLGLHGEHVFLLHDRFHAVSQRRLHTNMQDPRTIPEDGLPTATDDNHIAALVGGYNHAAHQGYRRILADLGFLGPANALDVLGPSANFTDVLSPAKQPVQKALRPIVGL